MFNVGKEGITSEPERNYASPFVDTRTRRPGWIMPGIISREIPEHDVASPA